MTRQGPIARPAMRDRRFVLATDLDGTFLGGRDEDRRRLYSWIEGHRASIGLVFVTGRDPAFIAELCAAGHAPWPEYVIGDVGTTIARVDADGRIAPIRELETEIAGLWGDGGGRVRAALDGHPGLRLQATEFRFRVSYDLDPDAYRPGAGAIVRRLGFDPLVSDNRFFDVLPRGVSKGPSLRRLVRHLQLDEGRVLAAGDTMNDLSMLTAGLPAVAVGGAEPALLSALTDHTTVHRATAVGAAGILEAVAELNLHDTPKGA